VAASNYHSYGALEICRMIFAQGLRCSYRSALIFGLMKKSPLILHDLGPLVISKGGVVGVEKSDKLDFLLGDFRLGRSP
jgi:hypothetical protein